MMSMTATGSGSLLARSPFTSSAIRCGSFLSTNSSYLNGIGVSPKNSFSCFRTPPVAACESS